MKGSDKAILQQGIKSKMPAKLSPMLCTLVKDTPQNPDYIYEIKWDGYRIISYVNGSTVRMDSRSGKNYTIKYPVIATALKKLKHKIVVDGEVVVFDKDGIPDFNAVQNYNGHNTPIHYYLFDIIWMDGYSLKEVPLLARKKLLKELVGSNHVLRISESFEDGRHLYNQMQERGLEGIVAKNKNSYYHEDERGNDWLKVPTRIRQEFVIGGWAESERARAFRSLLFGAYNNGAFEWIGRSGSGYKEKDMPGILKKLQAIEQKQSPFVNKVLDTKGAVVHWVKPKLVANFEFAAWTPSGRIRKPATFLSFRNDKKPEDVVREIPAEALVNARQKSPKQKAQKRKYFNAGSNWQKVDDEQRAAEWTDFNMKNCTIPVHNLDRELWKGISKGKLLLYYSEMADTLLPYIAGRPQSLVLKLTNAGSPRIFIKDMENRQPECAAVFSDTRRVKKEGKRSRIDYIVCNNKETLVYLVDLGCVDLNVWASRTIDVEQPDYIWLDLDPTLPGDLKGTALKKAEDASFIKAIEVAKATKKILDKYRLSGFLKTSGQTGLHVYIPCRGFSFEQARTIGYYLADEVHALVPRISTRNEPVSQRGENVYIDAGQNDYADTLAAPYSVRPYHEPLVSTPLEWKELNRKLNRYDFSIYTMKERLKRKGDLFAGVLNKTIQAKNSKVIKTLF
jgi:bifunctional non-homologous end joining protein LigD